MTRLFLVAALLCALTCRAAETPPSASAILQELRAFRELGSVLYIAAHPDDENTQLIAYLARGRGVRTGYLSITRGEGGQNLIGPELGDALGVVRTQELLAARRIDGGQQFFTQARDFGYSKDSRQTLEKWGHQETLEDVVRVIRTFQPDVIITRFSPEPGATHGHHTASAVLAAEAFKLADDPKAFPEQLNERVIHWQPKRMFWNVSRFGGGNNGEGASAGTVRLDIGGYLPLLGESLGEIAARSRSNHRSQGFGSVGSRGARFDDFRPIDGQPTGKDIFEGIDTSWKRFPGGEKIDVQIGEIIARVDPLDPSASVPALLEIRRTLPGQWPSGIVQDEKRLQLDRIVQACLGLYAETTVPQAEVVPGETLKLRFTAIARSGYPVRWLGVTYPGSPSELGEAVDLRANQPSVRDAAPTLPADTPLSQPYWLRADGTPGRYLLNDASLRSEQIGEPENWPAFPTGCVFEVGGQALLFPTELVQVSADPSKGEIRRELKIIPPVWLRFGQDVTLFAPGAERQVTVEVVASRADSAGTLRLDAPAGWKVSPDAQPFMFGSVGDRARFAFTVTAPPKPETADIRARATIDGKDFGVGHLEIRYEHIPTQLLQPPARCKAVCLDLAVRAKRIGYLPGAGDRVAESLEAMGCAVTPLTGADLTPERLRNFDAVVVGIRAFNVRTDLTAGLPALFAYAEEGGNVVVQYNTPGELKTPRLAPYDLKLSRDLPRNRVTDENAPVSFLAPDHPALNAPNRIAPADFEGWSQERGLNFPSEWDAEHFTALLACGDPGETPLKSGLLVARCGRGYFVYTGLSFFRQLPAGTPGAYRLFANLISLGK